MAYTETIKLRAYTLFLQGMNYEQIAGKLKNDFSLPKLRGQTVKGWAEKTDSEGNTWEDHRVRVRESLRQGAEEAYRSRYAEIRRKAETIADSLYDQLVDGAQIKSTEGAAYAWKQMAEFAITLGEMEHNRSHPVLIVQAMLDVFREIPAVRKAIQDNWPRIAKEIQARMSAEGVIEVEYQEEK